MNRKDNGRDLQYKVKTRELDKTQEMETPGKEQVTAQIIMSTPLGGGHVIFAFSAVPVSGVPLGFQTF